MSSPSVSAEPKEASPLTIRPAATNTTVYGSRSRLASSAMPHATVRIATNDKAIFNNGAPAPRWVYQKNAARKRLR